MAKASTSTKTDLTTPSVLAFARQLTPSKATFFGSAWSNKRDAKQRHPIAVVVKSVRGTIGNRQKSTTEKDVAKLEADIRKTNIQKVDSASLSWDQDTLISSFTLNITPNVSECTACNSQVYAQKLRLLLDEYKKDVSFKELSMRYAYNLANGRTLWRNAEGAAEIEIDVQHIKADGTVQTWTFNAFDFQTRNFQLPTGDALRFLQEVAAVIERGLSEKAQQLKVFCFARLGDAQTVYPSQEMVLDAAEKKEKSCTLYQEGGITGFHSQKVGNALRTIDTWYPQAGNPISVEVFGAVTTHGQAYRAPSTKSDLYTLFDNWILRDQKPSVEAQHFVVANLIRGNVAGESGKE